MKSSSSCICRILSCFALVVLCVSGVVAQVNRATITGTLTDASGAVIVGVEVSATNTGTNVVTTVSTNGDGIYTMPNLPPGTYAITFQKKGFKTVERPAVTLNSTEVAQINAKLEVGIASETLVVTIDAPVLDKENGAFGTNMKGDVVTDLPLSIYNGGRFVENFAVAITPGYSPISNPYTAVVNGGQYFTKDYTIDGTSGTSSIPGDSLETGPSLEAVQELQAQTSGLDSASAITSGGVISLNLKSGTNSLHGSLFGYGHNEVLDANTWTNNSLALPRPRKRAWDYGASIGGPIIKNKLFFFGTFERYTQTDFSLGGFTQVVPATPYLTGDFSGILGSQLCTQTDGSVGTGCGSGTTPILVQDTKGQTVPLQAGMIFDPTTCDSSGQNCKQFAGNMINPNRFSNASQQIVKIFQQDYAPGVAGVNVPNNRITQFGTPSQTPNQAVVKLDYDLTPKDRLSGSWVYNNRPRTLVDSGGIWEEGSTDGGPLSAAGFQVVKSDGWRLSESHSFTTNLLNVFSLTYNWYWNGKSPVASGTNWNQTLGFGDTGSDNFPKVSFQGPPTSVNAQAVSFIGTGAGTGPNAFTSAFQGNFAGANIITSDSATWVKGRHNFTFGGDFRAYQVNSHTGGGALGYNFINDATGQPNSNYEPFVGFSFASFLLGDVQSATKTQVYNLYGRRKAMSLFAQDSYKVTPKLTVNFGLRWAHNLQYHEKYGNWANYDLQAIDPTLGILGTVVYAKGGGDSFEKKEYWWNFAPQIGFAYSPTARWVVRGSFSLVYLPPSQPYFAGVPNAFAPQVQGNNQAPGPFNWDTTYPGVNQKGTDVFSLFPIVSVDPHALLPGFTDAFNFGVQYELMRDLRVEVAYVGNRGHHLPDTALAWNEPSPSVFLNTVNQNPGINPYNDYIFCSTKGDPVTGQGVVGINCPYNNYFGPALAAIAPYPQVAQAATEFWFYPSQLYVGLPIGQTSYNSMVIDVVKRSRRGWAMDLSYTYSRTRGDTYTAQQEGNNYYTGVQDFTNLSQAASALSNYDQAHVIKGYVTYDLPFGKGQRWGSGKGPWVNALIGGWTVAGLVQYTSGQPFQAVVDNPYYPSWGTFYPNFHITGGSGPFNPHGYIAPTPSNPNPPIFHYFSSSVASSPIPSNGGPLALGAGPPDTSDLRCPGYANENASILKGFSLGAEGRYQLQMRVEYYNLFNRHYYNINGCYGSKAVIGHSDFAQVTGINENPRNGQFGVRFTF